MEYKTNIKLSRSVLTTIILLGMILVVNQDVFPSTIREEHVLYVKGDNEKSGDGRSWTTAYNSLIAAIREAKKGDSIWVASGTYMPTKEEDRSASFQLKEDVAIYGGFSGGETRLEQRNWSKNRTVLSGDIGRQGYVEDNCYQVVKGANGAVLDGFVITGGYSINATLPVSTEGKIGRGMEPRPPGPPGKGDHEGPKGGPPIHISPDIILKGANVSEGAGMINYQVAPIVRNCIFIDNQARKGGGVYNMATKVFPPPLGINKHVPVFINCIFENNRAQGRGGGVANDLGTHSIFLNCVFRENKCDQKGGGMYNDFSCSPFVINCLFINNRADNAGAMGNDGASNPIIYYSTFTSNYASTSGPSIYLGTGPSNNPVLVKTIIWNNLCEYGNPGIYAWHDSTPLVEDSIVEGGYPGRNNSDVDPKLSSDGGSELDCGYKPDSLQFSQQVLPDLLNKLDAYFSDKRLGPPGRIQENTEPVIPSSGRIVYVKKSGDGPNDGRNWNSAYVDLSEALKDASRDGAQIWVASGIYRPSGKDRSASFVLYPGIRLYGGFNGNEKKLEQRDSKQNRTILSGDIGQQDLVSDNCYHVLKGADGAVVDGFFITGGYADGLAYDGHGGGMINYKRAKQGPPWGPRMGYSPIVRHCIFFENYARDGGAVYGYDRGKPEFTDCIFTNNKADYGGAVLDRVGVSSVFQGCVFRNNHSKWGGGALYMDYGSRPRFIDCKFIGNDAAAGHGGAIFSVSRASQLENTIVTLEGCSFQENTARGDGGAVAFMDNSIAELIDCTVNRNQAGRNGGGIAVTGGSTIKYDGCHIEKNMAGAKGEDIYTDASS